MPAAEPPRSAAPGAVRSLGERILVVGPSCSGKSTLAEALGERLGLPFIELDALFWEPGWREPPEAVFAERLRAAVQGERWVVAGNYLRHTMGVTWPRADTIIWLDFALARTAWRALRRSYRRWRRRCSGAQTWSVSGRN